MHHFPILGNGFDGIAIKEVNNKDVVLKGGY